MMFGCCQKRVGLKAKACARDATHRRKDAKHSSVLMVKARVREREREVRLLFAVSLSALSLCVSFNS